MAPTDYEFSEYERRIIQAIDTNRTTLTVNYPFKFKHASFIEGLSNDTLRVRAEVGLVTRNILVTGGDSSKTQYGTHILMHGTTEKGLSSRIENIEVSECGQPQVIGRHCIYFQMNGDIKDSYVKNNSIHDAYSNVIVLESVQGVNISSNVLFAAKGHGIYLQDGTETDNTIEGNLVLGISQSWYSLEACSCFWISNPSNSFRFNRAAGSQK